MLLNDVSIMNLLKLEVFVLYCCINIFILSYVLLQILNHIEKSKIIS